jgi:hypothetical protein
MKQKRSRAAAKYRSKFEETIAELLPKWNYEKVKVPYTVHRTYNVDFAKGDIYIEAKGFFRPGDTQKYKAIGDALKGTGKELVFLLQSPNKKVRKGAKMTMADWCEKEGFRWFTLESIHELDF